MHSPFELMPTILGISDRHIDDNFERKFFLCLRLGSNPDLQFSVLAAYQFAHWDTYTDLDWKLELERFECMVCLKKFTLQNVQNGSVLAAPQFGEGEDFMAWIVTGDESWVHHFQPESKRSSTEWKHSTSPTKKKVRDDSISPQGILIVFWDMQEVILQKLQPHNENVNATSYCTTLWELWQTIRCKWPDLLTKEVILLDGNACPHIERGTQELLRTFCCDHLEHPLYSTDLAPNDFHRFGPLKNHLGGHHFANDDAVIQEVTRWLRQQPKDFFSAGFQRLVKQWDKYRVTT